MKHDGTVTRWQRFFVVALVLAVGVLAVMTRRAGSVAEAVVASESHTFGNEAELARWATVTRRGDVVLSAGKAGTTATARGAGELVIEGRPRRAGYAPSISLRFGRGEGPYTLELGVRADGYGRSQSTATRIYVDGEHTRCVAETLTEEAGERRHSTRETPCPLAPGDAHELSTRMYVQHRVAFSSVDGNVLPPESVVWFPQTLVTPFLKVTWPEGGGRLQLEAFSMATPAEEYVSHGFDDDFRDAPLGSGRWFYVESDPSVAKVETVLGGPQGVVLRASPLNLIKGASAGILTSRQMELGAIEAGADIRIDDLHESGTVVRLGADSYWQPHRFDVGVFHAGEHTVGYCSGNWDSRENFETLPAAFAARSDRDLGTVRFRIAFEPKTGVATAYIDDRLACSHHVDLPPYVGAMLQIGANLHGPTSRLAVAFTRGWIHP